MSESISNFLWRLSNGDFLLWDMSVWGVVLVTALMCHFTLLGVTLYLHRCQSHRAIELHPILSMFFRFWLWMSTGMVTKDWVAIHRKHHAAVETPEDPHSPVQYGIRKVMLEGAELYRASAKDKKMVAQFGHGTPDDWMENNVFSKRSTWGIGMMVIINIVVFGPIGLTIWAIQMACIPFLAAGVINGLAHWRGYRNFTTQDTSTNIVPWGIVICGEELHNNHHAFGSSAKFSVYWWEFDIGWMYLTIFKALGLAKIKKCAPKLVWDHDKKEADVDTLTAILAHRFQVLSKYGRSVLQPIHRAELLKSATEHDKAALKSVSKLLTVDEAMLNSSAKSRLNDTLENNETLKTAYAYQQRLQQIWTERTATQERLLQNLKDWCHQAESSGIAALQEFARVVPQYALSKAS